MITMHHRSSAFLHCLKWPAIALVSLLFASQVFAQNLILNPSFETAGPANWTEVIGGSGGWSQSTSLAVAAVTDGGLAVASHNSDPGSEILYQDVTLPATGSYTFQVAVGCMAKEAATEFCRVDITDTDPSTLVAPTSGETLVTTTASGGVHVLVPVFLHDGTSGNAAIADTAVVNISALAGQTVRVRFIAASPTGTDGYGSGLFDNVRLIRTLAATSTTSSVPSLSEWGLILLALIMAGATLKESGCRRATRR